MPEISFASIFPALVVSHPRVAATAILLAVVAAKPAPAAAAGEFCTGIEDDSQRLICYDQAFGRGKSATSRQTPAALAGPQGRSVVQVEHMPGLADASPLAAAWELDPARKRGTFELMPHKLNYLLPVSYTLQPNRRPTSPAPDHRVPLDLPLESTEAKFQLSFKVKAVENLFGDNGDLWLGYTQQSSWQLYNPGVSSPFRATDHEPEVILSLRTDAELFGWRWRMLNLGFVHQSNGRPLPLSRSWNRVYAQFGFERGKFTVLARPWYRVPEDAEDDDNPDIRQFMGSGDLRLAYSDGGLIYSILGRYAGSGRGGAQFEWAFPISGALKVYVQITHGYGASLVDYNHSQTTIGAGMLLLPW